MFFICIPEMNQIFKYVNGKLNLIGKIQIKNLLMASLAAYKSGIKFEKIIKVLPKLKSVEGRLEKIGEIKNNGTKYNNKSFIVLYIIYKMIYKFL